MKKDYNYYDLGMELHSYEELLDMLSLHHSRCINHKYWRREYTLKIRAFALEKLLKEHSNPTLENNPIKDGAELVIVGQSNFKYKLLKDRMAALGIRVTTKVTGKTTHVLLGLKPTSTKGVEKEEVTLLDDRELQQELDRLEKPYLKEKENESSVEHLEKLLMSASDDNIMIAAQLMDGGGFPSQLLEATFIAYKETNDKQVRQTIKAILLKNINEATKQALKKTNYFHKGLEERKLEKNLIEYTRRGNELDADVIAKLMYKYHNVCIQYIFGRLKDRSFATKVLEKCITNNTLDVSRLAISKLPKELEAYQNVEIVNLSRNKFKNISPVLAKLKHLKNLDLSFNKIQQLNKAIEKMPTLKYLNVRGYANQFLLEKIDATKLKGLEEMNIDSWLDNATILPLFQAKLPHVKFTFD